MKSPRRCVSIGTDEFQEVVEIGPVNASIHKIDERVALAELAPIAAIYRGVLERLL